MSTIVSQPRIRKARPAAVPFCLPFPFPLCKVRNNNGRTHVTGAAIEDENDDARPVEFPPATQSNPSPDGNARGDAHASATPVAVALPPPEQPADHDFDLATALAPTTPPLSPFVAPCDGPHAHTHLAGVPQIQMLSGHSGRTIPINLDENAMLTGKQYHHRREPSGEGFVDGMHPDFSVSLMDDRHSHGHSHGHRREREPDKPPGSAPLAASQVDWLTPPPQQKPLDQAAASGSAPVSPFLSPSLPPLPSAPGSGAEMPGADSLPDLIQLQDNDDRTPVNKPGASQVDRQGAEKRDGLGGVGVGGRSFGEESSYRAPPTPVLGPSPPSIAAVARPAHHMVVAQMPYLPHHHAYHHHHAHIAAVAAPPPHPHSPAYGYHQMSPPRAHNAVAHVHAPVVHVAAAASPAAAAAAAVHSPAVHAHPHPHAHAIVHGGQQHQQHQQHAHAHGHGHGHGQGHGHMAAASAAAAAAAADGGAGGGGGVVEGSGSGRGMRVKVPEELEVARSDLIFEKLIGSGATAQVWRGTLRGTDVAVKQLSDGFILPDGSEDETARDNFTREMEVMLKIRHPNLVLFMGATTASRPLCVITEFCRGGNLFELLHQHRHIVLSWPQRLKIAMDIAKAMMFLHTHKPPIIHRDLKSLNVLLADPLRSPYDTPQAKVSDFGMSTLKRLQGGGERRMTGWAGTVSWMAPEVLAGMPHYDEKVDVYSFGVCLYELATRTPPFQEYEHLNPVSVGMMICNNGVRPNLGLIPPDMPPQLDFLMKSCWQHQPQLRPDFGQIIAILKRLGA